MRVLSRLFRRLFLEGLVRLHKEGKLAFFGELAGLADPDDFADHLAPLRKADWVVHAKPPLARPEAVLANLIATGIDSCKILRCAPWSARRSRL